MPTNARTASVTSVFGGGTKGAVAKRAKAYQPNPLLSAAGVIAVDQGYTNVRTSHLAAIATSSVGTLAENGTTINVTALPTITNVVSTLINIYIAVAKTSESDLAQTPEHAERLEQMVRAMVVEALTNYITHDSTNGLAQLISTLGVTGTSNNALVFSTIRAAKAELKTNSGPFARLMYITDEIGFNAIKDDIESSTGTPWASDGLAPNIDKLFNGAANKLGFTGFSYDQVDFWTTAGSGVSELYYSSPDTYDYLGRYPGDSGDDIHSVQEALMLGGRPRPSTRQDAELVGTINGVLGISKWQVPLAEDAEEYVYKVTFDCWVGNLNAGEAVRRKAT